MADLVQARWFVSNARMPAIMVAACLGVAPAFAASPTAVAQNPQTAAPAHLFGEYLAGRHAQQLRDFSVAASRYENAIAGDPDAPELISRTFLMEVCVGHFDRARALALKELKLDPGDAVAELVLVVDRLKAGDAVGALKHASSLPTDGVHRFIGPFALAWTRKAAGDLAGADSALQGLDKFNGFQPLKSFQLGLLYDFAGKPDKAQQYFDKALAANEQLNWRLTDAIANFYDRHGRGPEAKALYQRFVQQNTGSDLAMSVIALRPSTKSSSFSNSLFRDRSEVPVCAIISRAASGERLLPFCLARRSIHEPASRS